MEDDCVQIHEGILCLVYKSVSPDISLNVDWNNSRRMMCDDVPIRS